jgi:phospholipid-translocating ATPase
MSLVERDRQFCILRNAAGAVEEYDVLASFPFTSESKKMGILLRSRATKQILYYLKGAEVVMEPKIKAGARAALQESCENLALDGLRTLVFA